MNSYELSRTWFDWCFENPSKIKPIHSAIFFFAIEHCNRLGWKKEFGFPSQMTMDAIGVRKYQTYGKALNDLVEWGFVQMIEKSKNQYSANIISINAQPKNGKAHGKALDKALVKHGSKQGKSTGQSNGSINKQETSKQVNNEQDKYPFSEFWDAYDKKSDRAACESKWSKLKDGDKELIMQHVPKYVKQTPDKKYRKNPLTYLNKKTWLDGIEEEKERVYPEGYDKDHRPEDGFWEQRWNGTWGWTKFKNL